MTIAQGDRELVRDFKPQSARLRKADVMRLCRLTAAHKAGLARDENEMRLITDTFFFGDQQLTGALALGEIPLPDGGMLLTVGTKRRMRLFRADPMACTGSSPFVASRQRSKVLEICLPEGNDGINRVAARQLPAVAATRRR